MGCTGMSKIGEMGGIEGIHVGRMRGIEGMGEIGGMKLEFF